MSETLSSTVNEIPSWFKSVVIAALLWNLLGLMAFIGQMVMSAEMLAELSQAEQDIYTNTPLWATIAFAVAVFAGTLACLFLLLKKSIAYWLCVVSLAGVITQMIHSFFISNSFEVFGPGGLIMPIMVLIIAVALVWLSKKAIKEQWLT